MVLTAVTLPRILQHQSFANLQCIKDLMASQTNFFYIERLSVGKLKLVKMFQQISAVAVHEVSTIEGFTDQNKKPNTVQS